jgi:methionine-rich copper-binding protein CopC
MRPAGLLLAAVLAAGGVLASASAASAHDKLESTSPKQGSSVASPPAAVTLAYSERVLKLGSRIRVVGPAGDVADGDPSFTDQVVRQPIRPDAPAGTYSVEWQVTSSDGHPIAGTWRFTIQNAGVAATTAPAPTTAPATTAAPEPTAVTTTAVSDAATDDDSGGSTGLVVAVTAIAAAVLLAAAGAVAWGSRRRGS